MTKRTQFPPPEPKLVFCICAMIGFFVGVFCIQEVFFHQTGYTTFHRVFCIVGNATPPYDPVDTEEVVYVNGEFVMRKVTYKDGKVTIPEGNQALIFRAKVMTYGLASVFGLLGGIVGRYIARRASRCPVPAIESPPHSP